MDPDHLTGFKISNLYHHWSSRQKKKLQPFIVLNAGPLHQAHAKKVEELKKKKEKGKGKKTVNWTDISSDERKSTSDEGEESDGDEPDAENNDAPPPKFRPPGGRSRGKMKEPTQCKAAPAEGSSKNPLPDSASAGPVVRPVTILSVSLKK